MPKKLFRLGVADHIGLFVKKIVPLSATGIKINSLLGKCRVSRLEGQKCIVMPASVGLDPVSAGANNDIGQDSGGVIGVAKTSIIGQFPDLRVGKIPMDDRPQVLNFGPACRFRCHAVFGQ